LLSVRRLDDEFEQRRDRASFGDAPQQSCGTVGAQKLRCQVDECCLAPRMLHWPLKDIVVGD